MIDNSSFRLLYNGKLEREFKDIHELFDYGPETAQWFVMHPRASYFQYDHGQGHDWRYERVPKPEKKS